jgi:putative Mn2+ efflux pump MntP
VSLPKQAQQVNFTLLISFKFMANQPPSNNVLRYSGVGFQIMATVGVGFFIGYKLDEYLGNKKPYFAAGISVLFVFLALYVALKDLAKPKKK